MCTGKCGSSRGQLAVMDAMVFFCISVVICSLLISAVSEELDSADTHYGRSDANAVLSVFLRTTFDSRSTENAFAPDLFTGTETVADVLVVLAVLAADHGLPECYDLVADELLDAARSIAHPSLEPHISVLAVRDGAHVRLLVIEDSCIPESGEVTAASQRIVGNDDEAMVAVLALSVPSSSHLVRVCPG